MKKPHYRDKRVVMYDIEVFKKNWLVVFKNENHEIVKIFYAGSANLKHKKAVKITRDNLMRMHKFVNDITIVSFNGHHYDDPVLSEMLVNPDVDHVKEINDKIIVRKEQVWSRLDKRGIYSIDVMKQLSTNPFFSLKRAEANMGISIKESKIDFTIDRPLTDEEMEETLVYCEHDVDALIDIFKIREPEYFEPKTILINRILDLYGGMYQYEKLIKYNVTVLMGIILLKDTKVDPWATYRLVNNDIDGVGTEKFLQERIAKGLPEKVVEMWKNSTYNWGTKKFKRPKTKTIHTEHGVKYEFSFGGLHGVPEKKLARFEYDSLYMLDVTSLYPNIMINLNTLGKATANFEGIKNERVKVKHTNKKLSGGLKLGINSTYGCLISQYSALFNPYAGQSVCMYGQIVLFDLCQRLAELDGLQLVNVNTDGVGFTYKGDKKDWQTIWHDWEAYWNLELEEDYFQKVYQKDVNNYIGTADFGIAKAKGGQVSRWKENQFFKDNSLRILDICLVEALTNFRRPKSVIKEHLDDPLLFQQICDRGGTFDAVVDDNGNVIHERVNRVFAVRPDYATHGALYKKKYDGKGPDGTGSRTIFSNLSESIKVYNDDLKEYDNFRNEVDVTHYRKLAEKRLEDWGVNLQLLD